MRKSLVLLSSLLIGCGGGDTTDLEEKQGRKARVNRKVVMTWIAPTTNDDGSVLTDLTSYKVMYGSVSGNYTYTLVVGNVTTTTLIDVPLTPQWFTVAAINSVGDESLPATEVYK